MLSGNQFPSICKLCHPLYVSESYTDGREMAAAASGTMSSSLVSKSGKKDKTDRGQGEELHQRGLIRVSFLHGGKSFAKDPSHYFPLCLAEKKLGKCYPISGIWPFV